MKSYAYESVWRAGAVGGCRSPQQPVVGARLRVKKVLTQPKQLGDNAFLVVRLTSNNLSNLEEPIMAPKAPTPQHTLLKPFSLEEKAKSD